MPAEIAALLIAIEVSGPALPPDQKEALESACAASTGGRCEVGNTESHEPPDAVAIVSLSADNRQALVEIGRRQRERSVWASREMVFEAEDVVVERFRAIGLTIATLLGDVEEREQREAREKHDEPPKNPPAAPAAPPPLAKASTDAPVRERMPWLPMLALGTLAGPGLEAGWWRFGGFGRASLRFGTLPVWPSLWLSYARRPVDSDAISATWLTMSGGITGALSSFALDLSLRLRVEGGLERLSIEQTQPPTDNGQRWLPTARLGVEACYPESGRLALLVGADAWFHEGGTRVIVAGRDAAHVAAHNLTFSLGAELRFR